GACREFNEDTLVLLSSCWHIRATDKVDRKTRAKPAAPEEEVQYSLRLQAVLQSPRTDLPVSVPISLSFPFNSLRFGNSVSHPPRSHWLVELAGGKTRGDKRGAGTKGGNRAGLA